MEYSSQLYCTAGSISDAALDAIECLPTIKELDEKLTIEELSKVIDGRSTQKAPGLLDGI